MEIPPEVALQKYNSNYSASRAAINGWEYIIKIYRKRFSDKYYQPFYNLWFYIHVLKGKVQAPKYLDAKAAGNDEIIEAYSAARFTGVNMPMIDPKKEADAMRIMLGLGDQSPLATHEQVVEKLGNGDWESNMAKIEDENEILRGMGYEPIEIPPAVPEDNATKI
jgi:capsid protein